ncbi:SHOCT domain-containing protein [Mycetocola sp. 2940]|uniref:SHOCT domain-containing protein n=1 Tax=Mycetocola sp. 2940 TaxID=3156452 RepID=UPI003394B5F4
MRDDTKEELMGMDALSNLWGILLWFFWIYVFIAYLFALFLVLADIFRDKSLNGWLKAVWVIFLVFLPLATVIIYLLARGKGMNERNSRGMVSPSDPADYVPRWGEGVSGSDEIAKAQSLLKSGAISEAEYAALKAKALG